MITNLSAKSITDAGAEESNIAYITASFQPLSTTPGLTDPTNELVICSVALIFKPNIRMYNFFEYQEFENGKRVVITIATKQMPIPFTPSHVFSCGIKPKNHFTMSGGQIFEIHDIVLNDITEEIDSDQIGNLAEGRKKPKSVAIYTGSSVNKKKLMVPIFESASNPQNLKKSTQGKKETKTSKKKLSSNELKVNQRNSGAKIKKAEGKIQKKRAK